MIFPARDFFLNVIILTGVHSLYFISNVANCQLVSGFQLYTVDALLSRKIHLSTLMYLTQKCNDVRKNFRILFRILKNLQRNTVF